MINTMKAIVYTEYGSPDVLRLEEVEKPAPKNNEILIKIYAASVNTADWRTMRASPFLSRLASGIFSPTNSRLGSDVAGRVEAVGKGATQFQIGDEVFGCMPLSKLGSFAEYICINEELLAAKPAKMKFEAAAAVPLAALAALQGLRYKEQIRPGQKVLVNGASGGVGTFAVQIAKAFGAEVTGVCSAQNADTARSIGADHVIDFTKEDFTKNGLQYDLIFDVVGNRSVADYQRALSPGGVCSIAGFTTMSRLFEDVFLGGWASKTSSQKISRMDIVKPNKKDLNDIKELLETGKIVPVIDKTYSLSQVPEAIRYLEKGHAKGKVVIRVPSEAKS
jgi:NADPH:quinone reductase-like Zn-dependent oxidoreductase